MNNPNAEKIIASLDRMFEDLSSKVVDRRGVLRDTIRDLSFYINAPGGTHRSLSTIALREALRNSAKFIPQGAEVAVTGALRTGVKAAKHTIKGATRIGITRAAQASAREAARVRRDRAQQEKQKMNVPLPGKENK